MYKIKSNIKKIWNIPSEYHCSIIGTCLTFDEVKKSLKNITIKGDSTPTEYEYHCAAVQSVKEKNSISIAIQKILTRKYAFYTSLHADAKDDQLSLKYFNEAKKKGDIPGHYWAIISNPNISQSILNSIYGDIHMLSHFNAITVNEADSLNDKLREENKKLKEKQAGYKKTIKELNKDIKNFNHLKSQNKHLDQNLQMAIDEIQKLKLANSKLTKEINSLNSENKEHTNNNSTDLSYGEMHNLYLKVDKLEAANNHLKKKLYLSNEKMASQKSLSTSVCKSLENHNIECTIECAKNPEKDLKICGRCILYVGGQTSLVDKYRNAVENQGADFIYHDGGREDSFSKLSGLLMSADTVFCPLDHISHNACSYLKKNCKKLNKKFVLLKSSGVSSFSNELINL